jgi:hypothetical protein
VTRIRKWYLDCVTDTGEAVIVYSGQVEMTWLTVPYFEIFSFGAPPPVARLKQLSRRPVVAVRDRQITLDAGALGIRGTWSARGSAVEAVLVDGPRGRILWRCHQPAADVTLELPGGTLRRGSGYVEEIDMTLAPWALPFDELVWGRFVGDATSAVWIDWRGGQEHRWLFVGGQPREATSVSQSRVEWNTGAVDLDPGVTIRDGRIGPEVVGPLSWLLPRRVAWARETKWLSRACLRETGEATSRGWAIHEVVRWA